MKTSIIAILLFFVCGCSRRDDFPGLLEKNKMQAVLWDVINADVFTEQFIKRDSTKKAPLENMQLQNKIFTLHKVTRENFYKSYDYYIAHSDQMKTILDSMTSKAERDRTKMTQLRFNRQPK